MGIQGPSLAYVLVHGVLSSILLYMDLIKAMGHIVESCMWAKGQTCHFFIVKSRVNGSKLAKKA